MQYPTEGPYRVLKVNTNGTVHIRRGNYDETIHVRRVNPFQHRAHNFTKETNLRKKKPRLSLLRLVVAAQFQQK